MLCFDFSWFCQMPGEINWKWFRGKKWALFWCSRYPPPRGLMISLGAVLLCPAAGLISTAGTPAHISCTAFPFTHSQHLVIEVLAQIKNNKHFNNSFYSGFHGFTEYFPISKCLFFSALEFLPPMKIHNLIDV